MKNLFLPFFILLIFSCQNNSLKVSDQFDVYTGTNIAHWLSQSQTRGEERKKFFTRSDVIAIAAMGFDHIRLPIDEVQMWDDDGNRHEDAFDLMLNCIDWCSDNKLKVIIDLHILRSHYFNAKEKPLWTDVKEQEKFYDLWRDLSSSLHQFPNNLVAYELMNEAVADDPEEWNDLLGRAMEVIRQLEPKRTIVIGSNRWQSVNTFDELKIPENDPHILLSFHFYEPMVLTHYLASWTEFKEYQGPAHYPGNLIGEEEYNALPDEMKPVAKRWVDVEFNKEIILQMWKKPILIAKELGLPLYCGEFGVYGKAPGEDRIRWYQDMVELFNENGIGYANWNYKSNNFGLISKDGVQYEELITIVSPD